MMKEGAVKSITFLAMSVLKLTDYQPSVLTMSGVDEPSRAPKMLYTFNSRASLQHYAKGCDADIGGTSTVHFTLDESEPKPTTKFWGDVRLAVRPEMQGRILSGYAGFRSSVSFPYFVALPS
jgi:NADH dehydrogenase [ubiquinone] 1 alpha subcomplex assembly factor 1